MGNSVAESILHPGPKVRRFAGLPPRAAVLYALLFASSFWFSSWLGSNAPYITGDSPSYMGAAQDISDFHLNQLLDRPPGYPLFLILTKSANTPNRLLFAVTLSLHFLSVWILAAVLFESGLGEVSISLFALILLLPPYVESSAYVMSETVAEAALAVAFGCFVMWTVRRRAIWIALSSLSFGYAALTRPTYQFLGLALSACLIVFSILCRSTALTLKRALLAGLIFLVGSVVTVGSYSLINYTSFGYFGLSPKLG